MDSPTNENPQPVSSVSDESRKSPARTDLSQSTEDIKAAEEPPQQLPDRDLQVAIRDREHDHDQEREYGCKYCNKKFSNKQALGGHQNAHKVERTLEKTVREAQENGSYFNGTSASPFLRCYYRSHDFLNRSYLNWPYPPPQHGIHLGYSSRAGIMASADNHVRRPGQGFNAGWSNPAPRTNRFLGSSHSLNPRFPTGNASFVRPVTDRHDAMDAVFGPPPGFGPPGNGAYWMNVPGDARREGSGLDLTLRL